MRVLCFYLPVFPCPCPCPFLTLYLNCLVFRPVPWKVPCSITSHSFSIRWSCHMRYTTVGACPLLFVFSRLIIQQGRPLSLAFWHVSTSWRTPQVYRVLCSTCVGCLGEVTSFGATNRGCFVTGYLCYQPSMVPWFMLLFPLSLGERRCGLVSSNSMLVFVVKSIPAWRPLEGKRCREL